MCSHPLDKFVFCPVCGAAAGCGFTVVNEKAKRCRVCGFVYYFNPSAAVACFVRNVYGDLLLVRRAKEPASGTLDLPGGFVDMHETAEEAVMREVKEETSLCVDGCRYLFSLPNIYPYMGFDVHTLDLFFECDVEGFGRAKAGDDAGSIAVMSPADLDPHDFGLSSIRKAIDIYKRRSPGR
jgi:ADP-ribose pyrophosphatase YjhB (NUDIX family)